MFNYTCLFSVMVGSDIQNRQALKIDLSGSFLKLMLVYQVMAGAFYLVISNLATH
jgi:hypothetical protein